MDVHADTFVFNTLDRILMLSGLLRTSMFCAACAMSESHCAMFKLLTMPREI